MPHSRITVHRTASARFNGLRKLLALVLVFSLGSLSWAADAKRSFNIAAGDAATTLKQVALQAGQQVVFPSQDVKGVKTAAVKGEFTLKDALDGMLTGTGLRAAVDEKSGTFAVSKAVSPNAPRAAAPTASSRPGNSATAATDEAVALSVFTVVADPEDSYEALNTTGVTGTNRSIRSLPMTMTAFNSTFIQELNATDISDLLKFTPNITYGLDGTDGGQASPENIRMRGLTSKEERRRNGFVSLAKSDMFSVERVEVLRGAQAMLYGQGISSGAINTVTKRAMSARFGEARFLWDDNGTQRVTVDYNISTGPLSARVAGLYGRKAFWQDNIIDDPRGAYADVAWRLSPSYSLRASHEYIKEDSRTRIGDSTTIRDNTQREPRFNKTLDTLLFQGGDLSNIWVGGKPVSYRNYRSAQSILSSRSEIGNVTNVALEGAVSRQLAVRLAWGYEKTSKYTVNNSGATDLVAPTDSNAVDRQWSIRVNPNRIRNDWRIASVQASAVYSFTLLGDNNQQLIVGGEKRSKIQDICNQRLYLRDESGGFIRGTDNLGRRQLAIFYAAVQNEYNNSLLPIANYRWADNSEFNVVAPTKANPRGLSGATLRTIRVETQTAGYVNFLSSWFDDRLKAMSGVRGDHVTLDNEHYWKRMNDKVVPSGTAGVVYNVASAVGLYGNIAQSYAGAGVFAPDVDNIFPDPGKGVAKEVGLKFDLWNRKISGSLAIYENSAASEPVLLQGGLATAYDSINPPGINGRNGGNSTMSDVRARGMELTFTSAPTKGWRLFLGFGTNEAKVTKGYSHAILYNDQFNSTNGVVKVKQVDGTLTDLMVPSIRTNPASPRIPLTVAMLKDPTGDYRAVLDPISGRITNAAALFLTTSGVGTGVTGLPISEHQLGFVAPNNGVYEAYKAGDQTTPSAGFTITANTNYEIQSGWLRNVSVGASWRLKQRTRAGYAITNGVRQLYYYPDQSQLDLRCAYRTKLAGLRWNFQFTVQNAFDGQSLEAILDSNNGSFQRVNPAMIPRTLLFSADLRF